MRVWVLYNLSRTFGLVTAAVSLFFIIAALTLRAYQPHLPLPFVEKPPLSLTTCPHVEPQLYFLEAVLGLVAQMATFVFHLRKIWKDPETLLRAYTSRVFLIHVIIYIGIIGTMLSLNLMSSMVSQLYVPITESNVVLSISSLTCSQLILSLKRVSYYNDEESLPASKDEENDPDLFFSP